ncbi:hypothetical protein D3C78_1159910 [compost metagenome]
MVDRFAHHEQVAGHVEGVAHFHDIDLAQAAPPPHEQARVGRGGGVHLALQQRREVQHAGHHDFHVGFGQASLVQHHQQILARAAGQAVYADALALQVGGPRDVGRLQRHHVEHVLRIDVVDGAQLLALVQGHEERTGVGEGHVGLAAEYVADGVAAARAGQVNQFHTLRLEEALVGFCQQVGDFTDGLAPAGQGDLAGCGVLGARGSRRQRHQWRQRHGGKACGGRQQGAAGRMGRHGRGLEDSHD